MKYTFLILIFLSFGCKSLYFYHSNKISINTEVDPTDTTQPGLIHVGVRDRVAMIVPEKKNGEAVSSVSSFKFDYKGEWGYDNDKVEISTFLITGAAADALQSDLDAQQAYKAASGGEFIKDDSAKEIINWKNSGTKAQQEAKSQKLKAYASELGTSVGNFLFTEKYIEGRKDFNKDKDNP